MYISREKRRSLLHPNTAQRSFFFPLQSFLGKVKEKLARKANANTNATISDRVHASWASNNTPTIQLIQYVRRIGKKVYCFWDRY